MAARASPRGAAVRERWPTPLLRRDLGRKRAWRRRTLPRSASNGRECAGTAPLRGIDYRCQRGQLASSHDPKEPTTDSSRKGRNPTEPEDDLRFTLPLYTVGDAARYLRLPRQTLTYWVDPHKNRHPLVTTIGERRRNQPSVPFVGFTEAYVASVFHRVHGLKWSYIRKALGRIQSRTGLEHALASKLLYTDGAQIVVDESLDTSEDEAQAMLLVEAVSDNYVFTDVIRDYLKRIEYAPDGWVQQIVLPTEEPVAAVTPYKAYGQPLTLRGGARIVDILDRFEGNESFREIAEDFGLPSEDVEEVIRAFYKAA